MKYLVFSDVHGSAFYLNKILTIFKEENFEKAIFLGDAIYHGPGNDLPYGYDHKKTIDLFNELSKNIIAIKGNCDCEADQSKLDFDISTSNKILKLNNHQVLLTHGHHLEVDKKIACDIILHGHTHIKELCYKEDGKLYLCPGSISICRDDTLSYAILDEISFTTFNLLDKKMISKICF